MQDDNIRVTGVRAIVLLALSCFAATLGVLGMASSALATPKGEFAVFAECPLTTATGCIYAKTESGEFIVGKKTVPIEKSIVLQGGFNETESGSLVFVGAKGGNTLTKVPQNVPGGLLGLVNCKLITGEGFFEKVERGTCEGIFENHFTGVTATTELAGPASAIQLNLGAALAGEGIALSLPVKVHLENPLLGSSCYVGSNAAPIVLELTTGKTSPPPPNKSISGSPGTTTFNEGIITVSKNSLVNNSFAAPATHGCGEFFEFLIGPIINSELGVPSAAGTNTAILNGKIELTASEAVKEHE